MKLERYKSKLNRSEEGPSLTGWEIVSKLLVEINAYLNGLQRQFTVDIDWASLDGFQRQVLRITCEIPYGQFSTYGAIAEKLGKPGAARAVGLALGRNPMPIVIPCHRVIGSDRRLHGYLGGKEIKTYLLTLEGHTIYEHQLVHS